MLDPRELTERALRIEPGPARDADARRVVEGEHFPAFWSMLLEMEESLAESVSHYDRSEQERTMDAGGLATVRQFKQSVLALLVPEPKEPEPPKAIEEG